MSLKHTHTPSEQNQLGSGTRFLRVLPSCYQHALKDGESPKKKKKPLCVPVQYLTAHIVEKTQFLHLLKVSHGAPSVFNLYAALYTQLYMYIEVTPIQILTYSIE